MQFLVVVLIVVAAAALVIVPLVRAPRGAGVGDMDESGREEEEMSGTPFPGQVARGGEVGPSEPETGDGLPERRAAPPTPDPMTAPSRTAPSPSAPQPPGEAGAEELPQSAPAPAAPTRPLGARQAAGAAGDAATEAEILRYREALRAHTICGYCSTANPPGSKYCHECGERLLGEEDAPGRGGGGGGGARGAPA